MVRRLGIWRVLDDFPRLLYFRIILRVIFYYGHYVVCFEVKEHSSDLPRLLPTILLKTTLAKQNLLRKSFFLKAVVDNLTKEVVLLFLSRAVSVLGFVNEPEP